MAVTDRSVSTARNHRESNATGTNRLPPGLYYEPSHRAVSGMARHGNFYRFLFDLHLAFGPYVSLSDRLFLIAPPADVKSILQNPARFPKGDTVDAFKPLVGDGLFTAEGEAYDRQERAVKSAFSGGSFPAFRRIMFEELLRTCDLLQSCHRSGEPFDIGRASVDLTMSIAMRAFFGIEPDQEAAREFRKGLIFVQKCFAESQITQVAVDILHHVRSRCYSTFTRFGVRPGLASAVGAMVLQMTDFAPMERQVISWKRTVDEQRPLLEAWTEYMRAISRRIVEQRQSDGSFRAREDLLSRLLLVREQGCDFSDDQIVDEVATFFVAGHETTSDLFTALLWKHARGETPDVAGEEMRRAAADGAALSPERFALADFKGTDDYLRRILVDLPPVALTLRKTTSAESFGGYFIPEGSTVILSQYVTQRSPLYSAEMPEGSFEFGAGRRQCVGWRFAVEEAVMGLALLSHFELALVDPAQELEVTPGITIGYSRSPKPVLARVLRVPAYLQDFRARTAREEAGSAPVRSRCPHAA